MTPELQNLCVTMYLIGAEVDRREYQDEVEDRIKAELQRLPADERKFVLERVAVDVLATLAPTSETPEARGRPQPPAPKTESVDETGKQWEKILAYCQKDPGRSYANIEVAQALFPEKLKENRNVALSTVYTSTLRRSVSKSSEPWFVMLGRGKFRLATDEERKKAKLK